MPSIFSRNNPSLLMPSSDFSYNPEHESHTSEGQSMLTGFLRKKGERVSQETLNRAVRGHGNLIEYAPLFLILMLVAELNHLPSAYLHFAGAAFLVGRLMHGILLAVS